MATLLANDEVKRSGLKGYRIFIYSHDHPHPPHVHVGKRKRVSDWILETLECVDEDGFSATEIGTQRTILLTYIEEMETMA